MNKLFLAPLLLVIVLPAAAFTQGDATVSGTVSDASGALIPGVEVTATNISTGIVSNAVSNESGAYQFSSLQPGTYELQAKLPGFEPAKYENVRLGQSQQVRLNFSLQVSGFRQTVEVLSDTATVLATTTASISDVLPENSVRAAR